MAQEPLLCRNSQIEKSYNWTGTELFENDFGVMPSSRGGGARKRGVAEAGGTGRGGARGAREGQETAVHTSRTEEEPPPAVVHD